ncbi:PHP domain-containing protein [Streptomyces sp. PT12]|uniref:PHP domain-containing protein n=1 Tax=Streptomyces sp. PT12 TaxID=1510197 RepID=UPI000DE29600|nr:PHP domain-containing protein [Streptomyces sp. PT12]RBM11870.1 phosphatase [Streptomyces sp. PT12]
MRIDLHTHSTASDGTDTPDELVAAARAAGLDVVALTDHDTVAGHAAAAAALPAGLTLVTGAEISCRLDGVSLHMLGYLFDPTEPELARERDLLRDDRVPRAKGIVTKLQEMGVPITWERVRELAAGSVGRPHVAAAMVEAGVIPDIPAAFTAQWIGDGGVAWVDKHELDAFDAIRLIHNAGGVAVFAHPLAEQRGRCVPDGAIVRLAEAGLDGVEVNHMDHNADAHARLLGLAGDLGLLTTGSSDYHGARKAVALGEFTTPPEVYAELLTRAKGAAPLVG